MSRPINLFIRNKPTKESEAVWKFTEFDPFNTLFFTETVRIAENKIFYWQHHLQTIIRKCRAMNIPLHDHLSDDGYRLHRSVCRTMNKNNYFMGGVADISFFVKKDNTTDYIIQTKPIPYRDYILHTNPLFAGDAICSFEDGISAWQSEMIHTRKARKMDLDRLIPFASDGELFPIRWFDVCLMINDELHFAEKNTQTITNIILSLVTSLPKSRYTINKEMFRQSNLQACLLFNNEVGVEQLTGFNAVRYPHVGQKMQIAQVLVDLLNENRE